jgi:membrane protein implicated in regulation of membrane protease activity
MSPEMFLLPILGVGVFWLVPVWLAVPVYAAILAVSTYGFFVGVRARHRAVQTGVEAMAHKIGEVVDADSDHGRVQIDGEVWEALSAEPLHPGEQVEILGLADKLTLRVRGVRPETRG